MGKISEVQKSKTREWAAAHPEAVRAIHSRHKRKRQEPGPFREAYLARRRETRKPLSALQRERAKVQATENRLRRISNGRCESCTQPATHGIHCEHHWFKGFAYSHRMTPHLPCVQMLKDLWAEQGGLCAMTGEPLVINSGVRARSWNSASIDHKVARANGGTNSKDNLQWVIFAVNAAKADMPQDDFVTICRKVVAHADNRVVRLRKVET